MLIFFFKPKTADEMRIRDWSSDVCSSDLWNRTELLTHWREAWAEHVNERLVALDIDARIDHRTLPAQGIDLEPQHKIGPAASRMVEQGLDGDRAEEHLDIARRNGQKLLANPSTAPDPLPHRPAALTQHHPPLLFPRHQPSP